MNQPQPFQMAFRLPKDGALAVASGDGQGAVQVARADGGTDATGWVRELNRNFERVAAPRSERQTRLCLKRWGVERFEEVQP